MGNVARFAALDTKLDAIRGKLLDNQDYENLIALHTVPEIARYLKDHTHYGPVFEDINTDYVRRGDVAGILFKRFMQIMRALGHYMDSAYKEFFKALFMRYEVEDLKLILRGIGAKSDLKALKPLFIHAPEFSFVDFEQLIQVNNLEEFIQLMRNTPYQVAFRNITEKDLSVREFHAEMNLDAVYFNYLIRKAARLSKEDQTILKDIIGRNIDLINLQWVYRARKFYRLMPEEILNYTLAGGKSFGFQKLKIVAYADDPKEAIISNLPTRYANLLSEDDIHVDRQIYQYLYEEFVDLNRKSGMNISKLTAVLHFLEYEMRDIITITEAIRYDVKPEEVKDFLIRKF